MLTFHNIGGLLNRPSPMSNIGGDTSPASKPMTVYIAILNQVWLSRRNIQGYQGQTKIIRGQLEVNLSKNILSRRYHLREETLTQKQTHY